MTTGWDRSAAAWLEAQGVAGDFSREHVLDPAILERLEGRVFRMALDVGCGEGRFCRILSGLGIPAIGIDPTRDLLDAARARDPAGDYRAGVAEDLAFPDRHFDLVISYLTLIDIPDFRTAIAEMARVLRPGGTLIIANITGFRTALMETGWVRGPDGARLHYPVDRYMEERGSEVAWSGVRITNWHRPLPAYMQAFLGQGLSLVHFDYPAPRGGPAESVESYMRAPWLVLMEWRKPEGVGDVS